MSVFTMRRIGVEVSKAWGITFQVCMFETGWSLNILPIFGNFFIKLPFRATRLPHEIMEVWGFSWRWEGRADDIHLKWGNKYKILHMFWEMKHVRHSVRLETGQWHTMGAQEYKAPEGAWKRVYPYTYHTGHEMQKVDATVTVHERECRPRWLMWLSWSARISRYIDVEFSDEIGARRGSWKGGALGCGYTMLPNETPLMTLQRMEFERRFR